MEKKFSKYFDHTLLKPEAIEVDIEELCNQAIKYDVYSVCVNPYWVSYCKDLLQGTDIKVCSVISFPFGIDTIDNKLNLIRNVIFNGADEIDYVANLSWVKAANTGMKIDKSNEYIDLLIQEMDKLSKFAHSLKNTSKVKVILETEHLLSETLYLLGEAATKTSIDYLKTSTGYGNRGASIQDILILKAATKKSEIEIKASGGIKTLEKANTFIMAGTNRIGTSSANKIIEEYN